MNRYTAYILDDEPLAIRSLKKKLEAFPEVEIIGEATRMKKAVKELKIKMPDILFLDIQLDEGNGFDLLDMIDFTGKLIFVTAFDEFAFRAFEINALDYLLKPISHERLEEALCRLKKARGNVEQVSEIPHIKYKYNDRMLLMDKDQIRFILLEAINIIFASGDYSTIETIDGRRSIILRSLSQWMDQLPPEHFIRIHRSHIVNINHIQKMVRNSTSSARVYMKNYPEPLSLSRTYYKTLKNRYM